MDRGARRATVRGVAESQTRLKRLGTQRVLRYCRFPIIRGSGNEPLGAHSLASRCLNAVDPAAPVFPAWGIPFPPALAVGWENLSSAKCQSSTWAGAWLHPCPEPYSG